MKTTFFKSLILFGIITASLTSCLKDLNRSPFYGLNTATVYNDPANYIHVLAKLYGGLALTGNQGPSGKPDISGLDEGFAQYTRMYFNLQELPTDEAVCGWNDPGLPDLHEMSWTSNNTWTTQFYYRIYYQIPICNEFIRESADSKMTDRGFSAEDQATIREYRAEARFLRALSYYHAIDLYGNVPFIDENSLPGSALPKQISRADLFSFVESELLDIEGSLPDARTNDYGRADKACADFLLARLYLNAEVYSGQPKYAECITYCNKILANGYTLEPKYTNLFLADNNFSNEIIFPITFDGLKTQTWGGTTFLVHAPVGGSMKPGDFGIASGWGGYRTTSAFVALFPDTLDSRNLLFTDGQNLSVNDTVNGEIRLSQTFTDGYGIAKWKNVTSAGVAGSDPTGTQVDTDIPLFRLADVYLMYAEATLRGGSGGDMGTAVSYVNLVRERAYGEGSHDVASIDFPFILSERGREFQWEAQRRTDLIRFKEFTTATYLWPWKGNVENGTAVSDNLNLYPIPISDLIANPNLVQNPGY
jgi:starch-binding outer membrane protein, SusD/RagB family